STGDERMSATLPSALTMRVDSTGTVTRRRFLHTVAAAGGALTGLGWMGSSATAARELRRQGKAVILLWMAGGPRQCHTLDAKPGASTQGPTKSIATTVAGVRIAEHWPRLAGMMKDVAVIRSMTSSEGNHGRATYLLHTSYPPSGGITHPGLGSQVAAELGE